MAAKYNSKERRKKPRRKDDKERQQRILHIAKRLVRLEDVFNQEIDALLEELKLDRAMLM